MMAYFGRDVRVSKEKGTGNTSKETRPAKPGGFRADG
jgi:hypothetical protein